MWKGSSLKSHSLKGSHENFENTCLGPKGLYPGPVREEMAVPCIEILPLPGMETESG
jgi:hypothetical protein